MIIKNKQTIRQLGIFERFPIRSDSFCEENFLTADHNRCAISYIRNWPNWFDKVCVLSGGTGVGKTHIAKIWSNKSTAKFFCNNDILSDEYRKIFRKNFIIEDIDKMLERQKNKNKLENRLFNIINSVIAGENFALITTSSTSLNVLPDLLSRLKGLNIIHIDNPKKNFLPTLISKYCSDYCIEVDELFIKKIEKLKHPAKISKFFKIYSKRLNELGKKLKKLEIEKLIKKANAEKI